MTVNSIVHGYVRRRYGYGIYDHVSIEGRGGKSTSGRFRTRRHRRVRFVRVKYRDLTPTGQRRSHHHHSFSTSRSPQFPNHTRFTDSDIRNQLSARRDIECTSRYPVGDDEHLHYTPARTHARTPLGELFDDDRG